MYTTYIYYLLGSLTNSSTQLSRFTGLFKSIQSLGAAGSWAFESPGSISFLLQGLLGSGLMGLGLIGAGWVVIRQVRETNEDRSLEKQ